MLGHHADDNAEVILTRLAFGHKKRGLSGISPISQIPECFGLHGIYQSGQFRSRLDHPMDFVTGMEQGGINAVRPLLGFPKLRLVATCREAAVDWVEDKTNQDPTVTMRNAARMLLASGSLPRALHKPSLAALASTSKAAAKEYEGLAGMLYRACEIELFDMRTGVLIAHLPDFGSVFGDHSYPDWPANAKAIVTAIFLHRLATFVSPQEVMNLSPFQNSARLIFALTSLQSSLKDRTTAGGVMFVQKDSKPSQKRPGLRRWLLFRQPLHRNQPVPTKILMPLQDSNSASEETDISERRFALWDCRFWIHVENLSEQELIIRPFRIKDMRTFSHALLPKQSLRLQNLLSYLAPNRARWALPAICLPDHAPKEKGNRVISLPTLGITLKSWRDKVRWEIRYKRVDLGPEFTRVVVRGTKNRPCPPVEVYAKKGEMTG